MSSFLLFSTSQITKCNSSALSYKNDVVLDPFCGSGTSMVAAETLDRKWLGVELSQNYTEVAKKRVQGFVDQKKQLKLEIKEHGVL